MDQESIEDRLRRQDAELVLLRGMVENLSIRVERNEETMERMRHLARRLRMAADIIADATEGIMGSDAG